MGYFFHFSRFLGKNRIENPDLKSKLVVYGFYLIYKLICQKPALFKLDFLSNVFQACL
jgi:hypothetical protein